MNKIYINKNASLFISLVFILILLSQGVLQLFGLYEAYKMYLDQGQDLKANTQYMFEVYKVAFTSLTYLSVATFFGATAFIRTPILEIHKASKSEKADSEDSK